MLPPQGINIVIPGAEVRVAAGTYLTTTLTNCSIYFGSSNGVVVSESYSETETALSQQKLAWGFSSVLSRSNNIINLEEPPAGVYYMANVIWEALPHLIMVIKVNSLLQLEEFL